MKGRKPRTIPTWTMQQAIAFMAGRRGMLLFEMRHDDGCPAIDTQRGGDCRCRPDAYLTDHQGRDIAKVIIGPAGNARDN